MIEITRTKSWMERVGSWHSDVWNYLANIQELITNVRTLLDGQAGKITRLRVYTVRMVNADKEYRQALPANTKSIEIQTTSGVAFRISTETGRVGPANRPYWSVPTNTSWDRDKLDLTGTTLYFACSTANQTVEMMIGT